MATEPRIAERRYRVGLLLDSFCLYAWQRLALQRIIAMSNVEIALVILNAGPRPTDKKPFVYKMYCRLDQALFGRGPYAFQRQDSRDLFVGIDVLRVRAIQSRHSDFFSELDTATIRGRNLDILVRFGFRILRGAILTAAHYGVWSYHHGDPERFRGGPPCFWEVLEREPATGSVLQILSEDLDGGKVLCRSASRTDVLSVSRNKSRVYWKSASFLARGILALAHGRECTTACVPAKRQMCITPYSRPMYRLGMESGFRLSVRLGKLLGRNLVRKSVESAVRRQWFLLYSFREGLNGSLYRFKKLFPPRDRSWADPHLLVREGRYFVFIEELPFALGRGRIACLELGREGNWSAPVTVLQEEHHLSYPFVFEDHGVTYMIPESRAARRIDLYRCKEFPGKWVRQRTLMDDIDAADPTLLKYNGRYWLFANVVENPGGSSCDELFLYSADSLDQQCWVPHPANPVISDVKRARPAGAFFEQGGTLFRPAQDCSGEYGKGIRLNRIVELSDEVYREEETAFILPEFDPNISNMHTIARCESLVIFDAQRRIPKYSLSERFVRSGGDDGKVVQPATAVYPAEASALARPETSRPQIRSCES